MRASRRNGAAIYVIVVLLIIILAAVVGIGLLLRNSHKQPPDPHAGRACRSMS